MVSTSKFALLSCALAGASSLVRAEMYGDVGAYGDASDLALMCKEGEVPALLHTFGGVYDEGTFDPATTEAMSDEFQAVLDNTAEITGLPASGVSTARDADPAGGMKTSGTFGGFLLFSPETGSGAETYWDSPPHVAFGPTYVSTVSLDADDRGAATVQVALCVPARDTYYGDYHVSIVIDVAEGDDVDSEACRGTLVDTLNAMTVYSGDVDVPSMCGRQWRDWETLSFAEGITGFDFNKKNSADDVGCVYNFATKQARDDFVRGMASLADDACVGEYWTWASQ